MYILSLIVSLTLCTQLSFAANIAGEIRNPGPDIGVYFEFGIGVGYGTSASVDEDNDGAGIGIGIGIGIVVGGGYQYKELFLELSQGTADGINKRPALGLRHTGGYRQQTIGQL